MKSDQPVGGIQKNKAFRVKHLTVLTNIPPKSTLSESSSSESSSSESSSSSETSSSESSSLSESSSSESSLSDSNIDEIVNMIKYHKIGERLAGKKDQEKNTYNKKSGFSNVYWRQKAVIIGGLGS